MQNSSLFLGFNSNSIFCLFCLAYLWLLLKCKMRKCNFQKTDISCNITCFELPFWSNDRSDIPAFIHRFIMTNLRHLNSTPMLWIAPIFSWFLVYQESLRHQKPDAEVKGNAKPRIFHVKSDNLMTVLAELQWSADILSFMKSRYWDHFRHGGLEGISCFVEKHLWAEISSIGVLCKHAAQASGDQDVLSCNCTAFRTKRVKSLNNCRDCVTTSWNSDATQMEFTLNQVRLWNISVDNVC